MVLMWSSGLLRLDTGKPFEAEVDAGLLAAEGGTETLQGVPSTAWRWELGPEQPPPASPRGTSASWLSVENVTGGHPSTDDLAPLQPPSQKAVSPLALLFYFILFFIITAINRFVS